MPDDDDEQEGGPGAPFDPFEHYPVNGPRHEGPPRKLTAVPIMPSAYERMIQKRPATPKNDPRLPITIKRVPGGFALVFANGGPHIYIYGREPHVASSAGSLTIDQAKALAQDAARALTKAWSDPAHGQHFGELAP